MLEASPLPNKLIKKGTIDAMLMISKKVDSNKKISIIKISLRNREGRILIRSVIVLNIFYALEA
jgi:hypothetical protein